jgi:hypothetical protein
MSTDLLTAARAEALFASHLSRGSRLDAAEVAEAITEAVRAHGGTRGCAAQVAAEYGNHPETAPARMRWALGVVRSLYLPAADRAARWTQRPTGHPALPAAARLAAPVPHPTVGSAPPAGAELVAA